MITKSFGSLLKLPDRHDPEKGPSGPNPPPGRRRPGNQST